MTKKQRNIALFSILIILAAVLTPIFIFFVNKVNKENESLSFNYYSNFQESYDYIGVGIKDKDIPSIFTYYYIEPTENIPIWLLYENYNNEIEIKWYKDTNHNGVDNNDKVVNIEKITYQTDSVNRPNPFTSINDNININKNFFYILEDGNVGPSTKDSYLGVYDRFGNIRYPLSNYDFNEGFGSTIYINAIIGSNISYNNLGYIQGIYNFVYKYENKAKNNKLSFNTNLYGNEDIIEIDPDFNIYYSHDFTVDSNGNIYFLNDNMASGGDIFDINSVYKYDINGNLELYDMVRTILDLSNEQYEKFVKEIDSQNSKDNIVNDFFSFNSIEYNNSSNLFLLSSKSSNTLYFLNGNDLSFEFALTSKDVFEKIEGLLKKYNVDYKNWIVLDEFDSSNYFFGQHTPLIYDYDLENNTIYVSMIDNHFGGNSVIDGINNYKSYYKTYSINIDKKLAKLETNIDIKDNMWYEGSAYPFSYKGVDYIIYTNQQGTVNDQSTIIIGDYNENIYWSAEVNNLLFRANPIPLKREYNYKQVNTPWILNKYYN